MAIREGENLLNSYSAGSVEEICCELSEALAAFSEQPNRAVHSDFAHRQNYALDITRLAGDRGCDPQSAYSVLRAVLIVERAASKAEFPSAMVPVEMAWLISRGLVNPPKEGAIRFPRAIAGIGDGVSLLRRDSVRVNESAGQRTLHFERMRVCDFCEGPQLFIYSEESASAGIYKLVLANDCLIENETVGSDGVNRSSTIRARQSMDGQCFVLESLTLDASIACEFSCLCSLLFAAEMIGAARGLLDSAISYTGRRKQFDRPIADFQAVAHAISSAFVDIELCLSAVCDAATTSDACGRLATCDSYGAYFICADRLVKRCQGLMRMHGASGLLMGSEAASYMRRVVSLCSRSIPAAHWQVTQSALSA